MISYHCPECHPHFQDGETEARGGKGARAAGRWEGWVRTPVRPPPEPQALTLPGPGATLLSAPQSGPVAASAALGGRHVASGQVGAALRRFPSACSSRLTGGEAGCLPVSENRDLERKRGPIHYRVILARNGPACELSDPARLSARVREGFRLPCGCFWGHGLRKAEGRGPQRVLLRCLGTATPHCQSAWPEEPPTQARPRECVPAVPGLSRACCGFPGPAGRAFRG